MRKRLVVAAVFLASCQQDPPGRCTTRDDCSYGQECASGVCIALETDHQVGSPCIRAADCVSWAECTGEVCTLKPGMCTTAGDCESWQDCDALHACVAAAGYCGTDADCQAWEVCGASHLCENGPGYCATALECASWQRCNAVHACVPAPGFCAVSQDCAGWQTCDATHTCAAFFAMPDRIFYAGYLEADNGQGINGVECFASPDTPTHPFIALPEGNGASRCWIGPMGDIIYKRKVWNTATFSWNYEIRRAAEDALRWDSGYWSLAAPALDNDPLLLAAPSMDEFVLQEGTGAILHDGGGSIWYDESGNVLATGVRVLAWSQAGVALAVRYPMTTSLPVLIDTRTAVTTAVTGIELTNYPFLSARVHGSGFWLLVGRYVNPGWTLERWTIAADGTATLDGYFASTGPEATLDIGDSVAAAAALDGSGAAWAIIKPDLVSHGYVYRLELEPGVATRVVGDPPPGVNYNDVYPLDPFVVTGRSTVNCGIITGP